MNEKRQFTRIPTDIDIDFKVTEVQFRQSAKIESTGKLVDLPDQGFGLVTNYHLEKGQVITINSGGQNNIPKFGLVKWTESVNGVCRAGFGFKFNTDIE